MAVSHDLGGLTGGSAMIARNRWAWRAGHLVILSIMRCALPIVG
jgi:hypothetical protein